MRLVDNLDECGLMKLEPVHDPQCVQDFYAWFLSEHNEASLGRNLQSKSRTRLWLVKMRVILPGREESSEIPFRVRFRYLVCH